MPPSYEASLLLQKCKPITSLKQARQLHALILTTASVYPQSPYPYNNVLAMYARCGSLGDSKMVFDKMPQRNLISFNALIAAYSRAPPDHAVSALKLGTQIAVESLRPNGSTFTSLLQAAYVLEDWSVGCQLHAQVVKFGFLHDQCVQTSLLGMYSNCGNLESARNVFEWLVEKDVVAWNSIIYGNLKNNELKEGLRVFSEMLGTGVTPTLFTNSMVLNACSRIGDFLLGKVIHGRVIVSSILADLTLQNALLDMYCNCGDTRVAFGVFRRMEKKNLVTWNSMISGYGENGEGEKALNLFFQFRGISQLKPDEYTFAVVFSAMDECLASRYGKPLHAQVIKTGFEGSIFIGTTIVSMYFKNGETEDAQKMFYSVSDKDVVLWTEIITSHSRLSDGNTAIKFYNEMCREGHKVDAFALSGALNVCADLNILKQGEMVHSQALKTGYDVEVSVCGSLVDMYAKNGSIEAAHSICSRALDRDLKSWNSMLGGYSHHGMAERAFQLFFEILKHGFRPDQVTYLSLLSACNHSGLVVKAKFLWNYMKENGISPGPKHYSCMVRLLSRAGLLDEAEEMIVNSPYSDEKFELWRTLLSSCVIDKNMRIGVHAAEQVLKLDAEDSATHILLSNLYATAGKWDGVLEMRRKTRSLMLQKDPGLSWLEAENNNIKVFFSGIQSITENEEAQAALHRLQRNMKKSETDELDVNHSAYDTDYYFALSL